MPKEQLATELNGIHYPAHRLITKDQIASARAAGLVIVFGASDDLLEFDGAIHDQFGCYNGGTAGLMRKVCLIATSSKTRTKQLRPMLLAKKMRSRFRPCGIRTDSIGSTKRRSRTQRLMSGMARTVTAGASCLRWQISALK